MMRNIPAVIRVFLLLLFFWAGAASALAQPTGLLAPSTDSDGNFSVSWNTVSGVVGYKFQISPPNGAVWEGQAIGTLSTSFPVSTGANGNFLMRVRACTSTRCGAWSAPVSTTVNNAGGSSGGGAGGSTGGGSGASNLYPVLHGANSRFAGPASSSGDYSLQWTPINGANYYKLQRTLRGSDWADGKTYTIVGKTSFGFVNSASGTYVHRVRGCGVNGCGGEPYTRESNWHTVAVTSEQASSKPPLPLVYSSPPAQLGATSALYAADIAYGAHPSMRFDVFIPQQSGPKPMLVYYHGGGFLDGDKDEIYQSDEGVALVRGLLAAGVVVASVNYRLIEPGDTAGVIKPLFDGRYALQFMRYHADSLGIDPGRVVLAGQSAGAGMSLWTGLKNDMADPSRGNPVLRESTRVSGVVALESQATYDIVRWETDVFTPFGMTVEDMTQEFSLRQRLYNFHSIDSLNELFSTGHQGYRRFVDMLKEMSPDDPEIFIRSSNPRYGTGIPQDGPALFHHVLHAELLMDHAAQKNIPTVVYIPPLGISDARNEGLLQFILRKLQP